MKEIDVVQCQIQEWYPRFRRVSLRTKIHVLPQAYIDYLLEDGLFLLSSSEAMPTRTTATCPELQSEDYHHWDEEDEDDEEPEVPSFPELEKVIRDSIEELGGAVFPKLNWTAPKDTTWIATSGNLQCKNFGEISLLLKASDSVTHDLLHAFDSCEDKTKESPDVVILALRKWYDLRPELEFRAFVYGGMLVGICQREVTGFYASLTEKVEDYEEFIFDFFYDEIREQFQSENYTFDCYVTRDGKVKLVDFNTWGGSTLPLLFTWEELEGNFDKLRAAGLVSSRRTTQANGEILDNDVIRVRLAEFALEPSEGEESQTGNGVEHSTAGNNNEVSAVCDVEYRVEFRIVTSEGLVQPGMRIGTGIPIDFINKGNWEEVIRKEAADEALRERTAPGPDRAQ